MKATTHPLVCIYAYAQPMYITREDYDFKPLLVKQGALILWGVPLLKWVDSGHVRHLYRLNDFYAEMCYDKHTGRLTGISTFTFTS